MADRVTKPPKRAKKVFDDCGGDGCEITKRAAGQRIESKPEGFDQTTPQTTICKVDSARCPVQLIFKDGNPYIRLCESRYQTGKQSESGKPVQGKIAADMPVKNATEAQQIAREACDCWGGTMPKPKRREGSFVDCLKGVQGLNTSGLRSVGEDSAHCGELLRARRRLDTERRAGLSTKAYKRRMKKLRKQMRDSDCV